jgi:transposase
MARRCAGRRACRRWHRWPGRSGPRWPARRRAHGFRWSPGPAGPAWLPIAVCFACRGHAVYRVSSAKAADLRRFLRRHAKSNGIDAETLARMPLADPGGLQPLELPGADAAALDRRVRACERLTRAASEHKVRIKDLVRQVMPMTPLTGDLGKADLAILEHYADPASSWTSARPR